MLCFCWSFLLFGVGVQGVGSSISAVGQLVLLVQSGIGRCKQGEEKCLALVSVQLMLTSAQKVDKEVCWQSCSPMKMLV